MIAITLAGWSVPSLTGSSHAGTRAVARRKSFGPDSRIAAYFTFIRACMCVYHHHHHLVPSLKRSLTSEFAKCPSIGH